MSYRVCALAAPSSVTEQAICDDLFDVFGDLRGDLDMPKVYVRFSPKAVVDRSGLRFFVIETPGGDRYLNRESVLQRMTTPDVITLLWDDQRGIYEFDGQHRIVSVGPYLDGALDAITVAYARRNFDSDVLRALHDRDFSELSSNEKAAVMEYSNAIELGLGSFHPGARRLDVLTPLESDQCWQVADPKRHPKKPAKRKPPSNLRGYLDYVPKFLPTGFEELEPEQASIHNDVEVPGVEMTDADLSRATNLLNRAIALTHADDAWAHWMRARAYALSGSVSLAVPDLARAVELDPCVRDQLLADPHIARFCHVRRGASGARSAGGAPPIMGEETRASTGAGTLRLGSVLGGERSRPGIDRRRPDRGARRVVHDHGRGCRLRREPRVGGGPMLEWRGGCGEDRWQRGPRGSDGQRL